MDIDEEHKLAERTEDPTSDKLPEGCRMPMDEYMNQPLGARLDMAYREGRMIDVE